MATNALGAVWGMKNWLRLANSDQPMAMLQGLCVDERVGRARGGDKSVSVVLVSDVLSASGVDAALE